MLHQSRRTALKGLAASAAVITVQAGAQTLPAVERDFINTPAGQIHVRRAGDESADKTPIFCFHQSPQSSLAYADILPHLARGRLAVACDTPGFGESFRPQQEPIISDYAAWLAAVPRVLDLGQIDVVGMFTGSAIAVDLQRQFPSLVRRMVLIGPALFEEEARQRMYENAWPGIPEESGAFLLKEWNKVMERYPDSLTFEQKFNAFNEYYRGGMNAIYGERAVNSYDMRSALTGLTVPVLIIEPEGSMGRGEEAAGLIEDARYIKADGKIGLGLLQTEPEWVSKQILDFFDESE